MSNIYDYNPYREVSPVVQDTAARELHTAYSTELGVSCLQINQEIYRWFTEITDRTIDIRFAYVRASGLHDWIQSIVKVQKSHTSFSVTLYEYKANDVIYCKVLPATLMLSLSSVK